MAFRLREITGKIKQGTCDACGNQMPVFIVGKANVCSGCFDDKGYAYPPEGLTHAKLKDIKRRRKITKQRVKDGYAGILPVSVSTLVKRHEEAQANGGNWCLH